MIGRPLTTERFKKHFRNNFDLTNFAIHYAREFVMSGQEGNLDRILKNIDPASGDVRFFQSEMRQTLWKEISDPASGHAVIYKMYNHGFIF